MDGGHNFLLTVTGTYAPPLVDQSIAIARNNAASDPNENEAHVTYRCRALPSLMPTPTERGGLRSLHGNVHWLISAERFDQNEFNLRTIVQRSQNDSLFRITYPLRQSRDTVRDLRFRPRAVENMEKDPHAMLPRANDPITGSDKRSRCSPRHEELMRGWRC